ncbi:MAG: hypothetical protein DCC75_00930 [Proteobacteria bacterium]|nr:MAG: hypothetical protein DCC75_00930 [Pseudomonadota bacterium]
MPALTRSASITALIIILAAGAYLRFYNLNWDRGSFSHPDDRFMGMVAEKVRFPHSLRLYFSTTLSPLNPSNAGFKFYVYGTFPLFLVRLVAEAVGMESLHELVMLGRFLSASADTLSILVVFLLALLLYDRLSAVLASFFLAGAVLHVQHSHFFVVDTFLTLTCLITIYLTCRWLKGGSFWNLAASGLGLGVAAACKITALALFLPLGLATLTGLFKRRTGNACAQSRLSHWQRSVLGATMLLVAAYAVFRTLQPYAFRDYSLFRINPEFEANLGTLLKWSSPNPLYPPSVQWFDRSLSYAVENMVRWGMGYALGLLALAALVFCCYELVRKGRWEHIAPAAWAVFVLVYVSLSTVKPVRYLLPAYPFLILLAGYALAQFIRHCGETAKFTAGVIICLHIFWIGAFFNIYRKPFTRAQVSEWVRDNIAEGSKISVEHWDETTPARIESLPPAKLQKFTLPVFNPESEAKREALLHALERSQYVIINSLRGVGAITRWREKYPFTSAFYEKLLTSQLGFEIKRSFASYPALIGREFCSDYADESFSVYDHPHAIILKKTKELSMNELEAALPPDSQPQEPYPALELIACRRYG